MKDFIECIKFNYYKYQLEIKDPVHSLHAKLQLLHPKTPLVVCGKN